MVNTVLKKAWWIFPWQTGNVITRGYRFFFRLDDRMSASLVDGAYNSLMSRPAVKMFLQSRRSSESLISLSSAISQVQRVSLLLVGHGWLILWFIIVSCSLWLSNNTWDDYKYSDLSVYSPVCYLDNHLYFNNSPIWNTWSLWGLGAYLRYLSSGAPVWQLVDPGRSSSPLFVMLP